MNDNHLLSYAERKKNAQTIESIVELRNMSKKNSINNDDLIGYNVLPQQDNLSFSYSFKSSLSNKNSKRKLTESLILSNYKPSFDDNDKDIIVIKQKNLINDYLREVIDLKHKEGLKTEQIEEKMMQMKLGQQHQHSNEDIMKYDQINRKCKGGFNISNGRLIKKNSNNSIISSVNELNPLNNRDKGSFLLGQLRSNNKIINSITDQKCDSSRYSVSSLTTLKPVPKAQARLVLLDNDNDKESCDSGNTANIPMFSDLNTTVNKQTFTLTNEDNLKAHRLYHRQSQTHSKPLFPSPRIAINRTNTLDCPSSPTHNCNFPTPIKLPDAEIKKIQTMRKRSSARECLLEKDKLIRQWKELNFRKMRPDFTQVYDSLSDPEDEIYESPWLIHPESYFNTIRNYILFISLLYTIIFTPLSITFNIIAIEFFCKIMNILTSICFCIDILICFMLPYPLSDGEQYNYNHKAIAFKYISTWFIIDIVSAIPFSSIIKPISNSFHSNSMIELLKLLPIIKCFKMVLHSEQINQSKQVKASTRTRLIIFFLSFIIFNHTLACIWAFIASLNYPNWIIKAGIQDNSIGHIYIAAMYYNFATIYTIGYGDIVPVSYNEKSYNIILQSVGLFLYSFVVSSVMTIIRKSQGDIQFEKQMNLLDSIKVQYSMPMKLHIKIARLLKEKSKTKSDEKFAMIKELPILLQNDIVHNMYSDIVKFKFFRRTNSDFITRVIMNLKQITFTQGDILVRSNEHVEELIFVKRGRLSIECFYMKHLIRISEIRRGENYGDVDMLLNRKSIFDIVVRSKNAEVFLLQKNTLIQIACDYQMIFNSKQKNALINMRLFEVKLKRKKREIERIENENRIANTEGLIGFDRNYNDDKGDRDGEIDVIKEESNEGDEENEENEENITIVADSDVDDSDDKEEESINTASNNKRQGSKFAISKHESSNTIIQQHNEPVQLSPSPTHKNRMSVYSSNDLRHNSLFTKARISKISDSNILSMNSINLPKRKESSLYLNKKSEKILKENSMKLEKNLIEGSMNMKDPKVFYSALFEKLTMNNQLNKLNKLTKKIIKIHNSKEEIGSLK